MLFKRSINCLQHCIRRTLHIKKECRKVLGIETSCDDTGSAVIDEHGNILGEALNSQTQFHVEYV